MSFHYEYMLATVIMLIILAKYSKIFLKAFIKETQHFFFFFQAKGAMAEAEKLDPGNIFTQFYVFKVAILEGNCDSGINVIYEMHLTVNTKNTNNPL